MNDLVVTVPKHKVAYGVSITAIIYFTPRSQDGVVRPNSVLGPNTVLPDVTMPFPNKDASVAMPTLNS